MQGPVRAEALRTFLLGLLLLAAILPARGVFADEVDEKAAAKAAEASSGVAATAAGETPRPAEAPQDLLLGVIVGGREVSVIDAHWDGEDFLIPIAALRDFCQCDARMVEAGLRVVTPIGTATLGMDQLVDRAGVTYVRGAALPARLAMPFDYDPSQMALVFRIPWAGMREKSEDLVTLAPDVAAPDLSLSYATTQGTWALRGEQTSATGTALLMGRLADGQWRARMSQSLGREPGVEDYGWSRPLGEQGLMLLGHQRLDLHPLLEPLELLGAQAAWTNAPLTVFGPGRLAGELLPRQLATRTTISGQGVPAGIAVLRVDDRRVAATVIDLSGFYEFTGVQIPSGGRRVEVLIYDRQNPTVPVEIQEHRQRASDALLPAGAAVVQGAVGESGNPLGLSLTRDTGVSGFAQARYGVAPGLTVESTVQQGFHGTSAIAGAVVQFGRGMVASLTGGTSGGALGYQAEIDGDLPGWRVRVRSMTQAEGYRFAGSSALEEHFFEVSHDFGGGLEAGLLGRRHSGLGTDVSFLLPAASWRPAPGFLVRARPDSLGRYRFDLNWVPDARWRIGASRSGSFTTAMVSRQITRALRGQLFTEIDDRGAHREAAVLSWVGSGRYSPALSGGPLFTNGRPGVIVSAQAELLPGVLLGARYESSSLATGLVEGRDHRVALTLTTRHAVAGRRLMAAGAPTGSQRLGAVAGRIRVPEGFGIEPDELRNMTIRLNGRGAGRTRRNGSFFLPNLEPGVYRVEFDPDSLPLELTPRERSFVVEVAPGGVTDVEFHVDVEFGMAGRVRIGAAHAPDLLLEVVDVTGSVVATTRTDRWGLYRVDGLRVGEYRVRVAAANAPGLDVAWPSRPVALTDDFLFDQDLDLVEGLAERLLAVAPAESGRDAGEPVGAEPAGSRAPAAPGTEDPAIAANAVSPAPRRDRDPAPEEFDHGFAGHVIDHVTVTATAPEPELVPMRHLGAQAGPLAPPSGNADAIVVAWAPRPELVARVHGLPGVVEAGPLRLPVVAAGTAGRSIGGLSSGPPSARADDGTLALERGAAAPGDRSTPAPPRRKSPATPRRPEPIARYWEDGARDRPSRRSARSTGNGGEDAKGSHRERVGRGFRASRHPARSRRLPARQPPGHRIDPGP